MKLCLECPALFSGPGSRCEQHQKVLDKRRNADPKRKAYSDPAYRAIPLGGTCWICRLPGADTRDHVPPLAQAAPGKWRGVIRPAHRSCNSSQRATTDCSET